MNRPLALIRLRYRLTVRQFRGGAKWSNRLVGALLMGLGAAVSLGMAAGFGFLIHHARVADDVHLLSTSWLMALWSFAFFGLFLPLLRGGSDGGLEPESLLLYPVSRPRLFFFFLTSAVFGGSHLFYYPSLAVAAGVALLPPGPGSLAGVVILVLFVMVLVSWGHALALAVRALMARRRLRELIILGAMVLLILTCLLPALMERYRTSAGGAQKMAEVQGLLAPLARAASILPPSIAARGLSLPVDGEQGSPGQTVLYLALWAAAGLGAGYALFLREGSGPTQGKTRRAPGTAAAAASHVWTGPWAGALFRFLPPETRAVALKDLRYLMRSVLGRFSLLMAPVLILMFVFIFSEMLRRPLPGLAPDRVLLFSALLYIAFLSNNFLNNAFAWEGGGAQHYFLCPVDLRHVLLGKNIAVWAFNGLLFIVSIITWAVVSPLPGPGTLFTGLLVFAVALLLLAIGGNFVSLYFPVRRNPAAFMASPSQVGILIGILAMLASVLLCGLTLLLPALLGLTVLQPLFLLLLLAFLAILHRQLLGVAARIWAEREELFLQSVKRSV